MGAGLGLPDVSLSLEAVLQQPWLASAPATVVLQLVALVRLRGGLRTLSVVLAVITGAVLGLVLGAYALDPGNLWQLLLIMATPPILVVTLGLLVLGLVVGPRR